MHETPRQHRDRDVRSLTGPGMLSCGVNGQVQFVGRLVEGAIHVLIFHIILFVVHASSHSNNSQPPPRHPHPVLGPCQNAVACHHQLEMQRRDRIGHSRLTPSRRVTVTGTVLSLPRRHLGPDRLESRFEIGSNFLSSMYLPVRYLP